MAKKIIVDGMIQLGRELSLVRTLGATQEKSKFVFRTRGSLRVPAARQSLPTDHSGIGVNLEKFEYSLKRASPESASQDACENGWPVPSVFFEDQGLCQAYGFFGNPGCGKTYALMHLLRQLVAHEADKPNLKFGALILDPKGALMEDVLEVLKQVGREDDLVIVNERYMKKGDGFSLNVIDSFLEPDSLGRALSMAAQSAGISSKEPYWMNQLGALLAAAIQVLKLLSATDNKLPTLRDVARLLLDDEDETESEDGNATPRTVLEATLEEAELIMNDPELPPWDPVDVELFMMARGVLKRFKRSEDYLTMASFVNQSYGIFRRPRFRMFSAEIPPDENRPKNMYDAINDDGKIVLVSISKRNLALSKILCTVIKTLFQQTVLTRLDRFEDGDLTNFERPLLFLADEYSDVATELQGQPMGDGLFFSQMRQYGCMGLIATQNIHMLKNSALGDTWKGIFANLAAKVFMTLGDPETAEEATKLVGESEYRFRAYDQTMSKQGFSRAVRSDLKDKKDLPTRMLLQTLGRGEAVVVGTIDGKSKAVTRFIMVDGRERVEQ